MVRARSGIADDTRPGNRGEESRDHLRTQDVNDMFQLYEQVLDARKRPKERVSLSKEAVPLLPERFEETLLADIPDDAIASYRDMDAPTDSIHVHEFDTHWELHIDAYNPHYYPVQHAVADASLTRYTSKQVFSVTSGTVGHVQRLAVDASRLGTKSTRTVGKYLVESVSASVSSLRPSLFNR